MVVSVPVQRFVLQPKELDGTRAVSDGEEKVRWDLVLDPRRQWERLDYETFVAQAVFDCGARPVLGLAFRHVRSWNGETLTLSGGPTRRFCDSVPSEG